MADVYPVFNGPNVQFVPGIPAIPHLGITDKEAKALLATGAFTDKPPPPVAAEPKPKARPEAGPLDSPKE